MSDRTVGPGPEAELTAMRTIVETLRGFDDAAVRRILRWSLEALTTPQSVPAQSTNVK